MTDSLLVVALDDARVLVPRVLGPEAHQLRRRLDLLSSAAATVSLEPGSKDVVVRLTGLVLALRDDVVQRLQRQHVREIAIAMMD